MAPSATAENGAGGATDEVHPPAGVVIPPRDIRVILEKTAVYVARNGPVFEGRIREKEKTNQKFGFLGENDAYNAFYLWRLEEIREGRGGPGTTPGGRAGGVSKAEAAAAAEEEEAARKAKGPPRPPDFEFSARVPRINRKDLDVLQLTALHVARHGRGFMNALAQREAGNPQFAFLVPNHTFHNYFQSLTEQYVSLIRAAGGLGSGAGSGPEERRRVAELREKAADRLHTLKLAKQRAEWDAHQKAEKQRRDEEELLARYEYALVDWNDFVVVETIVFTEADNDEYLPPPTTLGDLEYASLEDKNNMSISANMRLEEAMPTDEDNPVYYNAYPVPQLPQQPQQPPDYGPVQPAGTASAAAAGYYQDEDEADRIREREEQRQRLARAQADAVGGIAPMKIRDNYIPRAAQGGANASRAPQMAICPNCKQQIPINELDAHMRIELLDPGWKEQKAKAESRYATSGIHQAIEAQQSLKRFGTQADLSDLAAASGKRAKPSGGPVGAVAVGPGGWPIPPPGVTVATPMPGGAGGAGAGGPVNVEEQIRAIHLKFAAAQQGGQQ